MFFHHLQAAGAVPLVIVGVLLVLWVALDGDGTRKYHKNNPYPQPYDWEKEE